VGTIGACLVEKKSLLVLASDYYNITVSGFVVHRRTYGFFIQIMQHRPRTETEWRQCRWLDMMLSRDLHFLVFASIRLFIFFEVELPLQPSRFFNGGHCSPSVHLLPGREYSIFCKKLITCAYVGIFRAENGDATKFDGHFELVVLDWCYEWRHLDFDHVTDFYRAWCYWLESVIPQPYKQVSGCFSYRSGLTLSNY